MFIRTITDRNGLNIVTETTNDQDYVNSTSFDWSDIGDKAASIGDYYYQGKIIPVDSPDYDTVISPLIYLGEEKHKKDSGLSFPESIPVEETPVMVTDPTSIEVPIEPVIPENLPPPKIPDYSHEPITEENLANWIDTESKTDLYLNRLKGTGVTFANNKVTFNPPLEYPDGMVQSEFFVLGHPDLNDLITYIDQVNTKQKELITRIRTALNIQ